MDERGFGGRAAPSRAGSVAHPFQLLRLEEVDSQAVEPDLKDITKPADDLASAVGHRLAPVDHPDSRTGG